MCAGSSPHGSPGDYCSGQAGWVFAAQDASAVAEYRRVSSSARGPINHVQLDRPLSFARMATTSGHLDGRSVYIVNASSGYVGPLKLATGS